MKMPSFRHVLHLRLQGKYSLVIFAMVAMVVTVLSGILMDRFHRSMEDVVETSTEIMGQALKEQIHSRAGILARFVSESLANPMYQFDVYAVHEILKNVLAQKDVIHAYVYEKDGRLMHDGSKENTMAGKVLDDPISKKAVAARDMLIQEEGEILDVTFPIYLSKDQQLGGVRIGLSLKDMQAQIAAMDDQLDSMGQANTRHNLWIILVVALVSLAAALLLAMVITRSLVKPIQLLADTAEKVGKGDLEAEVAMSRSDELGDLAIAFGDMRVGMKNKIRTISLQSATVDVCARELVVVKGEMDQGANQTYTIGQVVVRENQNLGEEIRGIKGSVSKATENIDLISKEATHLSDSIAVIATASEQASRNVTTMASAAEEMSANIHGVNSSLEQVGRAVDTVSRAIEQLTNSMGDVRHRCQTASQQSQQAETNAQSTLQVMDRLSHSAREIGKVVAVIKNIAEQTKMLALNAAIEAAGAGEAGKGFAVVANEVKELARQTTDATKLIADRINEIQQNTGDAAQATQAIARIVDGIKTSNNEIAMAVDEQSAATEDIAGSMGGVRSASGEVTRNALELADAAREVAKSALEAATGTSEIARASTQSAKAAVDMARQSQDARAFMLSILSGAEKTIQSSERVISKMRETHALIARMRGASHYFGMLAEEVNGTSGALARAQAGLSLGPPLLDVAPVKSHHLSLLNRLEAHIQGSALPAGWDTGCSFVRWCQNEGIAALGKGAPLLRQLEDADQKVHQQARQVVTLVSGQQLDKAQNALDLCNEERRKFFELLDKLYLNGAS